MDFNDIRLWFLLFVVVIVVSSIVRNLLNPPREMPWPEVPQPIRQAIESGFPEFVVKAVRHVPVKHEYEILGSYQNRRAQIEVECHPKGGIREIEFEDLEGETHILRQRRCNHDELSSTAREQLKLVLGDEAGSFQPHRTQRGDYGNESAFEIDGRSSQWKWEIEVTESGRLLEVEKSPLRS